LLFLRSDQLEGPKIGEREGVKRRCERRKQARKGSFSSVVTFVIRCI